MRIFIKGGFLLVALFFCVGYLYHTSHAVNQEDQGKEESPTVSDEQVARKISRKRALDATARTGAGKPSWEICCGSAQGSCSRDFERTVCSTDKARTF
jgi:hypothetical protein